MDRFGFSKKEYRTAAERFRDAWLAAIPEPEAAHAFSPGFSAWAATLLKKARRKETWSRVLRAAAGILIALVIASGVLFASNTYARERVVEWIKTVLEQGVLYRYQEDEPGSGEVVLPDADFSRLQGQYEFVQIMDRPDFKVYKAVGDSKIMLSYGPVMEGSQTQIVMQDYKCYQTKVNRVAAEFYECYDENGSNMLIWLDEESRIDFVLSTHLPMEETVWLAEQIEFTKNKEN